VTTTTPARSVDARRSEVVELGAGWSVSASYGFLFWPAEPPRFSILVRYSQDGSRRFGAYFDLIDKHFPHLKNLVPWNLCDSGGLPFRYEAGADYWYDLACGRGTYTELRLPAGCASFADALAKHLRCAEAGDRAEMDAVLAARRYRDENGNPDGGREGFLAWMEVRKPRLRAAMREAMEAHGIEEVVVETPTEPPYGLLRTAD
jgi:hypothetical protein